MTSVLKPRKSNIYQIYYVFLDIYKYFWTLIPILIFFDVKDCYLFLLFLI